MNCQFGCSPLRFTVPSSLCGSNELGVNDTRERRGTSASLSMLRESVYLAICWDHCWTERPVLVENHLDVWQLAHIFTYTGFPPKRPSVTAPWRFNFLPWRFSECRDALVSAVTLQEIPYNIGIVLRWPAIQINVRSYSITLAYCIAAWQCVACLCACPVVIWCHVVRHCWRVYQRVAGCIRPANTIVRLRNVDLMLVHRLQWWLNNKARCSTCRIAAITEHTPGVSQSSTVSTRTQRQHSV